jgi:DNA-binding MarR family transcriptional regulator
MDMPRDLQMSANVKRTRGHARQHGGSREAVALDGPVGGPTDGFSPVRVAGAGQRRTASYQLNNRIFFRLFQLGNQLQRQAVQQLGITTVQWAVLGGLSQPKFSAGIPLGELGEYLLVTRQNLDGVLKRLERDGLVQRVTADNDRRSRIVQLTPAGLRFWTETVDRICEFYDQATASFSFDDRVTLVHYMNRLQVDLRTVKLHGSDPARRRQR